MIGIIISTIAVIMAIAVGIEIVHVDTNMVIVKIEDIITMIVAVNMNMSLVNNVLRILYPMWHHSRYFTHYLSCVTIL